jgi:hypothetical protein
MFIGNGQTAMGMTRIGNPPNKAYYLGATKSCEADLGTNHVLTKKYSVSFYHVLVILLKTCLQSWSPHIKRV